MLQFGSKRPASYSTEVIFDDENREDVESKEIDGEIVSAIEQLLESRPRMPKANASLIDASEKLFAPKAKEPTNDPFVLEQREIAQRLRRRSKYIMLQAAQRGIPESMSLDDFVNSDDCFQGLRALQVFNHTEVNLENSREKELRDLVARTMKRYPAGVSNPLFVQELGTLIRSSFETNKLGNRLSPERKLLDVILEDLLPDLQAAEKSFSANEATAGLAEQLAAERAELSAMAQKAKIPGVTVLMAAQPALEPLRELEREIFNAGGEGSEALATVTDARELLMGIAGYEPRPGESLEGKIQQMHRALQEVLMQTGDSASLEVNSAREALQTVVTAFEEEIQIVLDPQLSVDRTAEQVQQRFDRLVQLAEGLGDGQDATWFRNRMVFARDRVDKQRKIVGDKQEQDDKSELLAELEYAEMVAGYVSLCKGGVNSARHRSAPEILSSFAEAEGLLQVVAPEAHRALAPELQEYYDAALSRDSAELEDQGLDVGFWADTPSYEVRLDRWDGVAPIDQIAVDQRGVAFTVLDRLAELDAALAGQFVEIADQAEREGWNEVQTNQAYAAKYQEAWDYVDSLRSDVLGVVGETVERSLIHGVDELPALSAKEKEAFAVLLEQEWRKSSDAIAEYQQQRQTLWQSGYRSMPSALLLGSEVRDTRLASLSDAALAERANTLQAEMQTAGQMYERLQQQLLQKSEDGRMLGYGRMVGILDAVPSSAVSQLETDFTGVVERRASGETSDGEVHMQSMLSDRYDTEVARPLQQITSELGNLIWFDMDASPEQLGSFFASYREKNSDFPDAELLIRRVVRFADKFSHLRGADERE